MWQSREIQPKDSKEESNLISRGLRTVLKFLFFCWNLMMGIPLPKDTGSPRIPIISFQQTTKTTHYQFSKYNTNFALHGTQIKNVLSKNLEHKDSEDKYSCSGSTVFLGTLI